MAKSKPDSSSPEKAHPEATVAAMLGRVRVVGTEPLRWQAAFGRVLTEPVRADRPSPAADVSAMDGYALRLADLTAKELAVAGEVAAGSPAGTLPVGAAIRVFTGAVVPEGTEMVIPREELDESPGVIRFRGKVNPMRGRCIRRCAENIAEGGEVVPAGTPMNTAVLGAIAAFGRSQLSVRKSVRVSIVTTGDELLTLDAAPKTWQIRDSNGPALLMLLSGLAWVEVVALKRIADRLGDLSATVKELLGQSDAVVITGGVSLGDRDHVPAAIREAGAEIVFHKLPIKPGSPMLGATGPKGQAILALPGNPVSAMVTMRRFGITVLRQMAGFVAPAEKRAVVEVSGALPHPSLWTYPLVTISSHGSATAVGGKGSGDVVSAARADGFVEVPPGAKATDRFPFWPWRV